MKVCKFGGSSLADSGQIKRVKDIIAADSERRYIVVSAPGKRNPQDTKVTDLLYSLHQAIASGNPYEEYFNQISERFMSLAKELGVDTAPVEQGLNQIATDLLAGADADYAASRGEFLNGRIIAEFLGATYIEPQDCIEIAEDGTVWGATYRQVAKVLEGVNLAVIPGFYGQDAEGRVKTFSRGGSDITGSIVARAVKADCYENWTDVSGVMMAHPGIVKNPIINAEMSFRELRSLAEVGTTVFHEYAVKPVRKYGIPIHIKNTNAPEDAGTRIVPSRDSSTHPIVGVTGIGGYTSVHIQHLLLNTLPHLRSDIAKYLERHGEMVFQYERGDDLCYVCKHATVEEKALKELGVDSVVVHQNTALLAVVGDGITPSHMGIFTKELLEATHILSVHYDLGGAIACLIPEAYLERGIKLIYQAITTNT